MCLCRPVTAVRRADHLPLWQALAVHVFGMGLVALDVWVLGSLDNIRYSAGFFEALVMLPGEMIDLAGEFAHELDRITIWIMLAFTALFTEITILVAGLIAMSLAARDEPWRKSFARTLRRVWLLTPHGSVVVLFTGLAIAYAKRTNWGYYDYIDTEAVIDVLTIAVAGLWSLKVCIQAVGGVAAPALCRWPACCIHCGYQLTGLSRSQDCPECGHAIEDSLSETTRPGIAEPGKIRWWLTQSYRAIRRPAALGEQMHVLSPDHGSRRCFAFTIAVVMLISPIAMGSIYFIITTFQSYVHTYNYRNNPEQVLGVALIAGTVMGMLITATLIGVALLSATVIGLIEGVRVGRNLMPAAIRAAGYQSAFVIGWAVVFWCNLVLFIMAEELNLLRRLTDRYNLDTDLLVFLWQGGVLLLGLSIYASLIAKATRAARHANW